MEQKVSELVVAEHVIGLGIQQVLELLPGLPLPSLAFMHQSEEKPLVNRRIAEKTSALGAELVCRAAHLTAAGTAYRSMSRF